jgi:protein CpxP
MNNLKLSSYLIVGLIISNVVLVAFLWIGKPSGPHHPPPPHKVIERELGFTPKQVDAYKVLIEDHQNQISKLDRQIREEKKVLFESLKSEKSAKDSVQIAKIATIQGQIESIHMAHFRDLKKICTKEQLSKFNHLVKRLGRIFAPHPLNERGGKR